MRADKGSVEPGAEVTALLRAWRGGDPGARERLIEEVYDTLKRLASAQIKRERPGDTLDATGLVHEAYLRLSGPMDIDWQSRSHFFAIASIAMRRVLVDRARARQAKKRGAAEPLVTFSGVVEPASAEEILDLDRALAKLHAEAPRLASVVEMRWFAGLELAEIATVVGVSDRTVKRDWSFARAWLLRELDGG